MSISGSTKFLLCIGSIKMFFTDIGPLFCMTVLLKQQQFKIKWLSTVSTTSRRIHWNDWILMQKWRSQVQLTAGLWSAPRNLNSLIAKYIRHKAKIRTLRRRFLFESELIRVFSIKAMRPHGIYCCKKSHIKNPVGLFFTSFIHVTRGGQSYFEQYHRYTVSFFLVSNLDKA
jgi:hypothetical protein